VFFFFTIPVLSSINSLRRVNNKQYDGPNINAPGSLIIFWFDFEPGGSQMEYLSSFRLNN
jgi:hypothetical protein